MRTKITADNAGYVREYKDGNPHVCEKLSSVGSTLTCWNRNNLENVIRSEYSAMRRAEKRELNRF